MIDISQDGPEEAGKVHFLIVIIAVWEGHCENESYV
jgi:hypothetical protein